MSKYILDEDKNPVACDDLDQWGKWFEGVGNRHVARTTVVSKGGVEYNVSTVFLGIDHDFNLPPIKPVLFETMVFGGDGDEEYCERCCTWDQAEKMHRVAVEITKEKGETK